ncbi:DNA repair protein RadA [Brucella abortus 01-4165]|uniref:DNA repair protein RadA n=9 Tax=Brucella/Ochrobactrum group TaxID=2826938 RepID=RADA_BRUA2|nr:MULTISPECIES: DNA repair protein RadA [Brucella]Q2YMH5.1 RecName: Full=DNA repair protein RadA; AltName: Full=Branch migration protein RadA [Brucella abortus 2308]ERM86245.1 DNA repair protein RadA [Brucella abortus 82]ERT85572.1 DNA repair protein RadA [Brucella abortus 90-12178]ERT97717.1 DNA repair protein RadA [Brucella abortus 99-9971-135]KFH21096.1 DNA repair protein RadA [Brucella abortus LMN1]KFH22711.1 DNA repair protein RadA [Brucella abortus LMN2]
MAKTRVQFICQNCGAVHSRWAGKCDSCGEWNTLIEEGTNSGIGSGPAAMLSKRKGRAVALTSLSGEIEDAPRIVSGISELDRVTGGGFVRGSALLIGGDPGIGKSTLLTQAAAALSNRGHRIVYVSGEEAVAQIRLRAQRLGVAASAVELAAETNVEDIIATISSDNSGSKRPDLVIIDSIQTLWTDMADSAPGTVTQVRSSAQAMIRYAKQTGAAVVLVGHVTKDGQIAGPRVVEHMVDGVLYFEGEGGHHYRILRTVKNRFGPTDEIGVFEMSDGGLREVSNPSELFLGERNEKSPGAAVFAGMEGTRPVLVEIQALVAPSSLGTPRRAVVGWDGGRLAMILAVLESHCGVRFGQHDVYLNVAGGYRISEPAADIAVAAALVSSMAGIALPPDCVYFGEISLSGAVRAVSHAVQRLKEAEKLGFRQAEVPNGSGELWKDRNFRLMETAALADLVARIAASGAGKK